MESRRITLDQVQVPEPCPAAWNQMTGDRRVRFCQHCQKSVYNLSALPRDEAERLVCESAGSLCVRFYRDRAGQVVTLDYQRPARPRRGWRYWTGIGTAAAVVVALVNGLLASRGRPPIGGACVAGAMGPTPSTWSAPGGNTTPTSSPDSADPTTSDAPDADTAAAEGPGDTGQAR